MNKRIDLIAGTALVVLWSSGFIGAQLGTEQAPAHTLLAWRYIVAAAILIGWCIHRKLVPTWDGIRRQAVLGFFSQFLYLGCIFTGVGLGVPAGISALIAALQPLVVAAASSRLFGDRITSRQMAGLGIGIVGVVLVVVGDLGGTGVAWYVYLLPLAGMLALSGGTVAEKLLAPKEPIPLAMAIQSTVGAVGFMTWSLLLHDATPPVTVGFWAAVAWTVVFATFGAYGIYMYVVRRNGPTRASVLLYLTPPTTMLWALIMFGDPITWAALAGLVVCGFGVFLYSRSAATMSSSWEKVTK